MRTRNVLAVAAVLAILLSGGSRTQLAQRAAAKGEGVVGYQSLQDGPCGGLAKDTTALVDKAALVSTSNIPALLIEQTLADCHVWLSVERFAEVALNETNVLRD